MDITIVINSAHRDSIITYNQFPKHLKEKTVIAIPEYENQHYKMFLPMEEISEVWLMPKECDHLPTQRQLCMNICKTRYIFFMDDDLTFLVRYKDMKLGKASSDDVCDMVATVYESLACDKIPVVGVSTRLGNNRVTGSYAEITRVTRCYALDLKAVRKVGAKFDDLIPDFVMEDFHLTLTMLEHGYKNRVWYMYAQQDSGSNAGGGCSVYRTQELQRKSALALKKAHPSVVTVKEKTTKGSWEGFSKNPDGTVTRTDVIVQWKKAFKPKRKKGGGIERFLK